MALSWGAALADFDNDGDLDLTSASGHIYPQIDRHPELIGTYRQKTQLLENRGGLFHEVTDEAGPGLAVPRAHRGLAVGDYDDDGRLDILMSVLDGPPVLLHNESRAGAWLAVQAEIPGGPAIPVGTRATVTAGGRRQTRDVAAGDSYASTHDPRMHFGLGAAERVEELRVRWPDGSEAVLRDLPARQLVVVRKER
jgi:hypothetical protein